ncbi:hypothetical protein LSM04_000848 [Trypanosoma melophagium]|uniref:uncharacterized protein n=1 Tax=Trypanosoma melophagium TaxID=715481 RepID=UPI00351A93F8|nr:hypothetical protein LSM04_000848 [Trypanosoma melophagium]
MAALTQLSTSSDSVSATIAKAVERTVSISISAVLSIHNSSNNNITTVDNTIANTTNSTATMNPMNRTTRSSFPPCCHTHKKSCKARNAAFFKSCAFLREIESVETTTATPSLLVTPSSSSYYSYSHHFFLSSTWWPFTAWLLVLLCLTLLTAFLVYRFLTARRPTHGEYEELRDVDAPVAVKFNQSDKKTMNNNNNNNSNKMTGGNASRQRFLESRRAAAQRSYGTADSAPQQK